MSRAEAAQKDVKRDLKQSLSEHVADKGYEIFAKYGPQIGWAELLRMMDDRTVVRYPCEIHFSAEGLEPGECAHPQARGERPEEGFVMKVHPAFMGRLGMVPFLVLYQLVVVNYGDFASSYDAEVFGAAAMGLDREDYYQALCALADELGESDPECSCG